MTTTECIVIMRRQYLRSHVINSANHSIGPAILCKIFLSESEVCDAQVVVAIQKDVLGLQIPVGDSQRVQMNESQNYFGGENLRHGLVEEP